MITLDEFSEVPDSLRGAFLTIGNFDGVHRGHRRLVARLAELALTAAAPAVVLTFDPHPVALLRPDRAPAPLLWTERKVALLREAGATEVGVFRTGAWLLDLTAREFFDRLIRERFQARGVLEGPNFAFGRDRGGNTAQLGRWCIEEGLGFEVVEPNVIDGALVSSSRVRECLVRGETLEASRLLGRPHRVRGIVVRGAGRGTGLGFPTANLSGIDTLIPADGVYAAHAYLDGEGPAIPAACHLGANVTFGASERTVEAHLIGFQGDLVGRRVELDFLPRLRGTRKFDSIEALLDQIRADVALARDLANAESSSRP